jgi:predicted nucleic acid-binding protein
VEQALLSLEGAEVRGPLRISVITEMERIVGCRNGLELRRLDAFLRRYVVVPLDPVVSELAAHLLRRYRLSHGLLIADSLIAATALHGNHALLTSNRRDFRFIEGLTLTE